MPGESGQPFLSEEDLQCMAEGWKRAAQTVESSDTVSSYNIGRSGKEVGKLHGIDFFSGVIPNLIDKKGTVKILDIGGGAGLFTQEVRENFGDKVRAYSTGLQKKEAREYRKKENLESLHKDDLRWRSVLELKNVPEFDLILDTYGEQYHFDLPASDRFKYFTAIAQKLLPGGMACIFPFTNNATVLLPESQRGGTEEDRIRAFEDMYNVRLTIDHKARRLYIKKNN